MPLLTRNREQNVRRLDVVLPLITEATVESVLAQVVSLSRKRRARILIQDNRYPLTLVRQLNALVLKLPRRIHIQVVHEGTTVSANADARLTLSAPLSEHSLARVKRQMVRLRQRVLIGSGWTLESLRDDIIRTHDVRFQED